MSHYQTALAMQQRGLKPATKIVLYWLADHHNSETGACFPSLKTLAAECEMDVATIKRHLVLLGQMQLIERTKRYRENGSQTSSAYALKMCHPPEQNAPPPSAKCATTPAQNNTPHNLGSNNLGNEEEREPRASALCSEEDLSFEQFWETYPRKVGKGAAKKSFDRKVKAFGPSVVMDGLKAHLPAIKQQKKDDGDFRPHPATWLNQERFNDPAEEPEKKPRKLFPFGRKKILTGPNGQGYYPDEE